MLATRDRPEALRRCLHALTSQDVTPREIIVVYQGSELPREDALRGRDGVEVVLLRDEGAGVSRARNLALAAARCPVIAVVDDDCVPTPGWLAAIADEFAAGGRIDAVSGPVLPLPPAGGRVFPISSRTSMVAVDYRTGAVPWRVGTGGNFAARTEFVRTLGGYDCRLGPGSAACAGEDIDLIYRMLRSGATIRYCPQAVVGHQRVDAARRRLTRSTYGRGIGAFVGIRGRERDLGVGVVLWHWVLQRLARLTRAGFYLDRLTVAEEARVLAGTARGLVLGLRLAPGGDHR